MSTEKVSAIIIDDDFRSAKQIQAVLPEYVESKVVRFKDAKETIGSEFGESRVGIVIMDADDSSGRTLPLFKYITEDPDNKNLKGVATVLITQDEFSDSSLEFLEVGEPFFYVGEVDESDFYLTVSDAIEAAQTNASIEEVEEPAIESEAQEKKAPTAEKLMGMSYKINVSEDKPLRIAAYKNEAMIKYINKLTGKNKEKTKQVIEVLKKVSEEKAAALEPVDIKIGNSGEDLSGLHKIKDADKVSKLLQDEDIKNSAKAIKEKIRRKIEETRKKKILIVDTDPLTKRAFQIFLGDSYEYGQVDSSMKAVDYVVKNEIDIVAIAHDLNGVPGLSVLSSIQNQPNGRKSKAFVFMKEGTNQFEINTLLMVPGVTGVIFKPILKKQLLDVFSRV